MTFPLARHGAVTIVDVGRELSFRSGAELRELIAEQVQEGARQFVFDFGGTEFIDSAGLGALISMSRLVHSREGIMKLMRLNDDMRRLFELTKLDTLFDVVEEAGPETGEFVLPTRSGRGPGIEQAGPAH